MRIAITGTSKLAGALIERFAATPFRIGQQIDKSRFDILINNAHVDFEQCNLLMQWFEQWRHDDSKLIINVSSRAGLPNLSKGYLYGAQKAALDHLADNLVYNSDKRCRITTINLGMLEDDLPSVSYQEVADLVQYIIGLPAHLEIPRVFLQHRENYQEIQRIKSVRYQVKTNGESL